MTIPVDPIYYQRIRQRAQDAVRRISEKPTDVTFSRANGSLLPAQTIRIEHDNSASASESVAGAVSRRKCILFGVNGHDSIPNSDIKKGYRFTLSVLGTKREYEVVSVIVQSGEVQAVAESPG